jgi:ATP-dependent DNA helicase PIF1
MNQQRLQSLHGESFTYTAQDSADDNSALRTLQYSCPAKEKITLKIGAQVILVKTLNVAMGLVNGARGVVVRIIRETRAPVVKFFDGNEHVIGVESFSLSIGGHVVAQRSQIPLDLAWAISVHKSQGMTVDQAELHLKSTFECGQAYGKSGLFFQK